MSELPKSIHLREVGPREGFQFEKALIATADKIAFIDSLSETGLREIEFVSYVSPKWVPQMADAEQVVSGIRKKPGVTYLGIWLNAQGLERAVAQRDVLTIEPGFIVPASNAFSTKNMNKTVQQKLDEIPESADRFKALGFDHASIGVATAFGCNYEGDIPEQRVIDLLIEQHRRVSDFGMSPDGIYLLDTMGWANPMQVKRIVGAVRSRWPDLPVRLHLHDTRGLAVANLVAGLEMGVERYDTAVAGLGGCPFAGHKGAAGNVSTEDVVLLAQEMGIETGIDLDRLIEVARRAEELVGHPLPGKVKSGGNLASYRAAPQRSGGNK